MTDKSEEASSRYNEAYYQFEYAESGSYQRDAQWRALTQGFATRIAAQLHPSNVLDVGCAIGLLVEALVEQGIDATGVDVSEYAISQAPDDIRKRLSIHSLTEPLDGRYDLVTCIEVLEHLDASDANTAVKHLCQVTDQILVSTPPEAYEEATHFNVQPTSYWAALFAEHGFRRNLHFDGTFISPWATLYVRSNADLPTTVREYEDSLHRARAEATSVRSALLKQHERLAELTAEHHELRDTIVADLTRELDLARRLRDAAELKSAEASLELLRLRDEVIGLERELGTVRARVAEQESEVAHYSSSLARLEEMRDSTVWRTSWMVLTPYRRLRTMMGSRR